MTGIFLMNAILTVLLVARFFYVKVISDPCYAFALTKGMSLKNLSLYFTVIKTLLQFEMKVLQESIMEGENWVVYVAFEKFRTEIRERLAYDLNQISHFENEKYERTNELKEVLKEYYESAVFPFNNKIFIINENELQPYRKLESLVYNLKAMSTEEDIALGLLVNNTIEARVKNPMKYIGFFTHEKFFLSRF